MVLQLKGCRAMNSRSYKTVFSKRLGALVAVGEHASSQGKATGGSAAEASASAVGPSEFGRFVGALTASLALVSLAWAGPVATVLPTGGQVVQGAASISQTAASMSIVQGSAKAAINWNTFDIGVGAKVHIVQPGSGSVLLNRVTSANPSQIFGQLNANGQVVLVNPNGIVFGQDGSVSASSFTASTLGISDADFLAGNNRFQRNGSAAAVVNQGTISTTGGYVALLGASVSNEGRIQTQGGTAYLAAAETIKIPVSGSGRIKLELTPSSINAAVSNAKGGTIVTEGGQVYMQAAALNNAVASIIQSGSIDTTGHQGGAVHLLADDGQIKVDGLITANSTGQDEQGLTRKGGDIVIGRDEETGALARWTDVRGAQLQSAKGFVETSGDVLATAGVRVKAGEWLLDPYNITIAASGASGTAYTSNYTSGADSVILAADINASLNAGTSVTLATGASGASAGDINVNASIAKTAGGDATLTLKAHNDIVVAASTTITSTVGKLNVVFNSDLDSSGVGGIAMATGAGITSNGGNVTFGGGTGGAGAGSAFGSSNTGNGISLNGASISSGSGNVNLTGTSYTSGASVFGVLMDSNAAITTTTGTVAITATGQTSGRYGYGMLIRNGSKVTTGAGNISVNATGSNGSGSDAMGIQIRTVGSFTTTSGNVSITGTSRGTGGDYNGGVDFSGGSIVAGSTGTVTVSGTGSSVGATSSGVNTANVTTTGAAVNITGASSSGGATTYDIVSGAISTSGGNVTFTGNSYSGSGTETLNAGAGTVTIQNRTASTLINLGGADVLTGSPLTLGISNAEIARITAGTIVIGSVAQQSGNLTVSAAINTTSASNFTLVSNNVITVGAAISKTGTADQTLTLSAQNGIDDNAAISASGAGKLNVVMTGLGQTDGTAVGVMTSTQRAASRGVMVNNTSINANGGDVTITGTAYSANSSQSNGFGKGVLIHNGSSISARNITVTGVAENQSGETSYGVVFQRYPTQATLTTTGDIAIVGTLQGAGNGTGMLSNVSGWGAQAPMITAGGKFTLRGNNRASATNSNAAIDAGAGMQVRAVGDIVVQAETNNPAINAMNFSSGAATVWGNALSGNASFRSIDANGVASGNVLIQSNQGGIQFNDLITTTLTSGSLTALTDIVGKNISIDNTGAGMTTGAGNTLGSGSIDAITGVITRGTGKSTSNNAGINVADGRSITASNNINIFGAGTTGSGVVISGGSALSANVAGYTGNVNISGENTTASGAAINISNASSSITALNYATLTSSGTGSGTSLVAAGSITVVGELQVTNPASGSISGAIGGAGMLRKVGGTGAGTLVLTGTNTYTGGTTANGGVLQVGNGGTIGTLGVGGAISVGASLSIKRSDTFEITQNISGVGQVSQIGTGTTIFSGTNSYSGATTVSAGTLQIGKAGTTGTLGSGAVSVVSGANLNFNRSDAYTVANTISGAGTVSQNGSGAGTTANLTLTGDLSAETGAFNVNYGVLTFSSVSANQKFNGSAININNASTVKVTSGGGSNFYSFGTTWNFDSQGGGTIDAASPVNFVMGVGTTSANNTFNTNGGATNTISGAYTGGINTNASANISTFNVASGSTSVGLNVTADLWNAGSITKSGAGVMQLAGLNPGHYSGSMSVAAGTLQVGDGSANGYLGSGAVSISSGASLILNRSDTWTVSNTISGAGYLTKSGAGTAILTGNNTYSGSTTISAGTLQIGNGGTSGSLGTGSVVDNSNLSFNRSNSITVSGAISGTGSLSQTGSGTTTLTADNTYAGVTAVSGGTLQVGNAGSTGTLGAGDVSLTNNANLSFVRSVATTIGNSISGTGNVSASITGASSTLTVSSPVNLTSGTVNLAADSDLSVTAAIATTNATSSAVLLNAGKSTAAGTSTGGSLLISGSGAVTVGSGGRATLMTGSVTGSTGLTALVGSGTGRFRYNSDETSTNYTTALGTGLYAIYREAPALTATLNGVTKTYDGLAYSGGNGIGTLSGYVNGDTAAQLGSITYGGAAQTAKNYGTYALTGTVASGVGYAVTLTSSTLTVNKANLTLSGTRAYDAGTTFAGAFLTATGVNGETFAVTGSGDATNLSSKNVQTNQLLGSVTGLNLGTSSNGGLSSNYNALSTTGSSVSVTTKAASYTATATNVTYNGSLQSQLASSKSGFISGDVLTFTGEASGTNANTYTSNLQVSGADANNYNITVTNANLVIGKANLTLTGSRVYDRGTTFAGAYLTASGVTGESFTVTGAGDASNLSSKNVQTAQTLSSVTGLALGVSNGVNTAQSSNYNPLSTTGSSVSVTAKSATVDATPTTVTYNGSTQTQLAATSSGFIVGDAITITGLASGKNFGTYSSSLAVSGADAGNYSITRNEANLVIGKATLTATGNSSSVTYNGASQSVSGYVITGLLGSDTVSDLANNIVASGATGTNAGSYTNTVTAGLQTNYTVSTVNGSLSIAKAALTATGKSSTVTYNGYNQSVVGDFDVTGLQGSDTKASLSSISASGATAKNAGDYVNLVSAGTETNYTVTAVNGNLHIGKAGLVATGNSANVTYNGANQSVSGFTVSGFLGSDQVGNLGSISASGATGKNVGTFTNIVTAGTETNYTVSTVNGSLQIGKANLTLSGSKVYDASTSFPGASLVATGVGGETVSVTGAAASWAARMSNRASCGAA